MPKQTITTLTPNMIDYWCDHIEESIDHSCRAENGKMTAWGKDELAFFRKIRRLAKKGLTK